MIQGSSRFVFRVKIHKDLNNFIEELQKNEFYDQDLTENDSQEESLGNIFVSAGLAGEFSELSPLEQVSFLKRQIPAFEGMYLGEPLMSSKLHVDVKLVDGLELDIEAFKNWRSEFSNAIFIKEEGDKFLCTAEIEKMSKSKYNVVNPDDIVERYGADTFRMYEMFLGPVEQSKPWDTKGIEGVHRFLRKFWRLYVDEIKGLIVTNETPTPAELKVLHKTIKKIEEDTERFSFNTAVSAFMVCVNELNDLKCHKKDILEPLVILLTPYAPHIAAELYELLKASPAGRLEGVLDATFPAFEQKYLVESSKEYPVSINGKHRTNINISLDAAQPEVEQIVVANEVVQKWLDGKAPKKIIFVKGKMINVVI
jgi:leucyl-tRNA synthetase